MSDSIDITISSSFRDTGVKAAEQAFAKLTTAQNKAAQAAQKALQAPGDTKLAAAATRAAQATQKAEAAYLRTAQASARLASASGDSAGAVTTLANALKNVDRNSTAAIGAQTQLVRAMNQTAASGGAGHATMAAFKDGLAGIVGPAAAVSAALAGVGAAVQSFADAFTFKAELDATTASINAQIKGVRDSGEVFAGAARFAEEFKLTQQETTQAIAASIGVMRSSKAPIEDILSVLARMQVLSPEQSLEEAAIALKALASGDTTSLVTRFEVGRDVANQMKQEIAGGADAVQVMSKFLGDTGIGMDTLKARTEGAMGAMKDLAKAQEDLKIAQAEWANGPGLAMLETQTKVTLGLTRALGGGGGLRDAFIALSQQMGLSTGQAAALFGIYVAGEGQAANLANAVAKVVVATEKHAAASQLVMSSISQEEQALGALLIKDAEAADQAERLAAVKTQINGLAGQVAGGYMTMADAARVLAAELGLAADEAARLIGADAQKLTQAKFAGQREDRERRAAGAGPQEASASALAYVAQQEKLAKASQDRRTAITRTGGAARASAEKNTADQITAIARQTADKLAAIDEAAAQRRAKAAADLAATISTQSADMLANQEANDLELVGASEEQRAQLMAREQAEATARIAQADAVAEARARAEAGDAEGAQKVLEARTTAIQQQQSLDEDYAKRRQELASDPAATAALKQQYDEATAAIAQATDERIALAELESQQRAQAIAAEKQAVLDAAAAQAAALGTTGSAADTAAGRVQALQDALASLPTNVTTTITINEVRTSSGGASASSGGGSAATAKLGGGGELTGVTNGPMTVTLGDNPGGVEAYAIRAVPISGVGRSSAGAGDLRLAGGTVDDAARRAEERLRNAPGVGALPVAAPRAAPRSGGGSGATQRAAEEAAKEERAAKPALADYASAARDNLGVLEDVLKLRMVAQDPALWAPISDAVLASATADADTIARRFTELASTYEGPVLEASKAYSDALGGAFSVIQDGLKTFDVLRGSEMTVIPAAELAAFERNAMESIGTVERLGVRASAIPLASVEALGNVASAYAALPSLATFAGGGTTTNNSSSFGPGSVVINAAPGMDINALASLVEQRISARMGSRR